MRTGITNTTPATVKLSNSVGGGDGVGGGGEWWWWRSGFGAGGDAGEAPAGAAALAQIWQASKDVMASEKTFGIPQ